MIRRYPPNRMLSILVVLLAMAAYFSFELYSKEHQSNNYQLQYKGKALPQNLQKDTTPKTVSPQSFNTEVQGNRPEDNIIRPGAIIIIEKKYTKCGHVSSTQIDAPEDMVNLNESQFKLVFKNWNVSLFSPEKVILSKEIQTKCMNHFILKEKDGFIAVYYQESINGISLKEVTSISVENLPQKEKSRLKEGIKIESVQDLAQTLEDLSS
ncbi:MAG: BofC C-terminal domain-containing protein [Ignavibacteriales bacterium]